MSLEEFLNMDLQEEIEEVEIPRIHLTFKLKPLNARMSQDIALDVFREQRARNPSISMQSDSVTKGIMSRLLLASIVEPDLLDPRLLSKAKVHNPEEFLLEILRPGEYDSIIRAYRKLNKDKKLIQDDLYSRYVSIVLLELHIRPTDFLQMTPKEQAFIIASLSVQSDELQKMKNSRK